jgi:hypothetical protein
MGQGLRTGVGNRGTIERGDGNGGVVDYPIDDHFSHVRVGWWGTCRQFGQLPGKLLSYGQWGL